jgi:adenine deaminase
MKTHAPIPRGLVAATVSLLVLAASGPAETPPAGVPRTEVPFNQETKTRQDVIQTALLREPADLIIHGANVLNVFTLSWMPNSDIVIKGDRIAWVGPAGEWKGTAASTFDASNLWAVPGFGEAHKHIESTNLSPEWEAALNIPLGNTWTDEGSHEFSNVNGEHNVEFWLMAAKHGSPLKIFPELGSATPPTAFERGGGYYGYNEISENLDKSLFVAGLDEVMDWPAVSDPTNPGYQRMWEDIQATRDHRAVIEGHGAGLWDLDRINAFAGSGISSDHETRIAQEAWDKMQRGVFMELRDTVADKAIPLFVKNGLKDWSNVSLVTDDRNVYDTLKTGTMNYHVKMAIQFGAPIEAAYAMASYYPARHAHVDPLVGSIAPGRFADVVLVTSVKDVAIKYVFCNGKLAAQDGKYILAVPKIDWPSWATDTINVGRKITAKDFEILAPPGRTTVEAAIQTPSYTAPDQKYMTLPVVDGVVQRDISHDIIKVADIDRYFGNAAMGKMFFSGLGPKTPDSALATSVSHDLHEIAVFGTSDEAMALAVNTLVEIKGGIVLVNGGKVVSSMRLEIGGLMTCRPIEEAAANLEQLYTAADSMEWIGNPGFPRRAIGALITCSPYTWRLVIPYPGNPSGLVSIKTGETLPIIR